MFPPFPFLCPCRSLFLFLPLSAIAIDEMLDNVCRWFHHIVSWRVAIAAYNIFDVIAFAYMTHYAIQGLFSQRISDSFLLCLRVHCLHFFLFSLPHVGLRPAVLSWRLLHRWGSCSLVHRYSMAYSVLADRHCRWHHFKYEKRSSLG